MDYARVTSPDIGDLFRGVSGFFFVILFFQIAYVVYYYLQVINLEQKMGINKIGLLLLHVVVLGGVVLGYSGTLTIVSYRGIGNPVSGVTIVTTLLNAFTVWGLRIVMAFERRRYEGVVELTKTPV